MRHQCGFSLLEVLVAMTIMTVALVSLAQVLALATTLNAVAGRVTFATALAAQKVEMLRGLDWDSLQLRIGRSIDYLDRAGLTSPDAEAAAFTREALVEPRPEDPANLVGVQVTVRSAREMVELATSIARHTP